MKNIYIYQISNDNCPYEFASYNFARTHGLTLRDYSPVYKYSVESFDKSDLDKVYEKFNMNRPEDFTGHSLSMSDLIVVSDDDYNLDIYYVDRVGFYHIGEGLVS